MRREQIRYPSLPLSYGPAKRIRNAQMSGPAFDGHCRRVGVLDLLERACEREWITRELGAGCVRKVLAAPRYHHRKHLSHERREQDRHDPDHQQNDRAASLVLVSPTSASAHARTAAEA